MGFRILPLSQLFPALIFRNINFGLEVYPRPCMLELKLLSVISHILHIFGVLLKQSDHLNLIRRRVVNLIWHSLLHDHVVDELVGELIEHLQCQLPHTHIFEIIVLHKLNDVSCGHSS
jgi:hypothetical protein